MRLGLPELPDRMRHLSIDERGYPVPFFVAEVNGKPDFRIMDGQKLHYCIKFRRCWLCGGKLGKFAAFVIGPMCAINRISAEPPSHLECAVYAAKACPFLTTPKERRREANMPDAIEAPAGEMISRNPGVVLIWVTTDHKIIHDSKGGILFNVGTPCSTEWFSRGKMATRAEILESIETGLPILKEMAAKEGPESEAHLELQTKKALALVPP